ANGADNYQYGHQAKAIDDDGGAQAWDRMAGKPAKAQAAKHSGQHQHDNDFDGAADIGQAPEGSRHAARPEGRHGPEDEGQTYHEGDRANKAFGGQSAQGGAGFDLGQILDSHSHDRFTNEQIRQKKQMPRFINPSPVPRLTGSSSRGGATRTLNRRFWRPV